MKRRVVIYKIKGGVAVRSFDFGENIYVEFWGGVAYCQAAQFCMDHKLSVLLLTDGDNGRKRRRTGLYH
jgi:hypothetical protein